MEDSMKDADENFKIDLEIKGYDSFEKKYYFKEKGNTLYLLSEDDNIMNSREINENEITTLKGSLFFELTGDHDVTAFSTVMSAKISYKINNVQKLIFISERTAEYILSNIGEVEKTTIKNDLKNLFLNKELQIRYNFVLLHPICFKIDERKKVATYTRLTDINEEILNTLKEPEIDSIDLREYIINVENKKDNTLYNNIEVILGDITEMAVDVIVNAANKTLLGGGGVDGAIHKKAGIELYNACKKLQGCDTGEAKITDGYNLNVKKIIHTVSPIWFYGKKEENEVLLKNCYQNSYKLAKSNNLKTIAFPCLGMGVYQIPLEIGGNIAIDMAIQNATDFEKIYLVCYGKEEYKYYCNLLKERLIF